MENNNLEIIDKILFKQMQIDYLKNEINKQSIDIVTLTTFIMAETEKKNNRINILKWLNANKYLCDIESLSELREKNILFTYKEYKQIINEYKKQIC